MLENAPAIDPTADNALCAPAPIPLPPPLTVFVDVLGILAVDGKRIIPLDAEVIKKRRKMMEGGSLVATIVVDKAGQVLGEPQFSSFGLLTADAEHIAQLADAVKKGISDLPADQKDRDDLIDNAARTAIRKFLNEHYGKKPLIEIHLVRI
jgi:ribonuclease J